MLTIEKLASFGGGLPVAADLTALLKKVRDVYEGEDFPCRPRAGGLLDFTKERLPVIIVPDLHARPDFLINLLKFTPDGLDGKNVLEALNEGRIIVVCVGDGVHTERYGEVVKAERMNDAKELWKDDYERWMESFVSWQKGRINCPSMREEMRLCLATVMTVMELKCAFPKNFHFLKGNHENIKNEDGRGNHAFRKFAMEGEMVKDFMQEVYGNGVLNLMYDYETSLPIVAAFDRFCVSHAEPERVFSKDEIIDYHGENWNEVVLAFTWTPNDGADEGSVASIFAELTGRTADTVPALWFGGHRPVEGKYFPRQDGHYVQIHNPDKMNVVSISAERLRELEESPRDQKNWEPWLDAWLDNCIISVKK